jgi:hypothetical protein
MCSIFESLFATLHQVFFLLMLYRYLYTLHFVPILFQKRAEWDQFSGSLPTQIGRLTKLTDLDLGTFFLIFSLLPFPLG